MWAVGLNSVEFMELNMEMIKYCVTRLLVIKNNGLTAIRVHQNMFPCVKIGENGDLHSVGPVIFCSQVGHKFSLTQNMKIPKSTPGK